MEEKEKKFTRISEIGEFGLIDRLTNDIALKNSASIKGIGDDAAVLGTGKIKTVVSTDFFMEGIHFNISYSPLMHLGYKVVVIGLSDIIAMNAKPGQILINIGVTEKYSVEILEKIYEGIKTACAAYDVDFIGGDTSPSMQGLTFSITAIGTAREEDLVYRSGAKPNNLLCVTGNLGASYMGLQLLERENKIFKENPGVQPELKGYEYVLSRQLKPELPVKLKNHFVEKNIKPTSMIDISDGLASEIFHICKQSDCGCEIYQEEIPIDKETAEVAEELKMEPLIAALNGGEDFEILFTIDLKDYDKIKDTEEIHPIGKITSKEHGKYLVTPTKERIPLTAQGWL